MTSDSWRSYCASIANMPGYQLQHLKPLEETRYLCECCKMEITTGIKLQGKPHKAWANKCGGTWGVPQHEWEVE